MFERHTKELPGYHFPPRVRSPRPEMSTSGNFSEVSRISRGPSPRVPQARGHIHAGALSSRCSERDYVICREGNVQTGISKQEGTLGAA